MSYYHSDLRQVPFTGKVICTFLYYYLVDICGDILKNDDPIWNSCSDSTIY